jgi:hypothetical protein
MHITPIAVATAIVAPDDTDFGKIFENEQVSVVCPAKVALDEEKSE